MMYILDAVAKNGRTLAVGDIEIVAGSPGPLTVTPGTPFSVYYTIRNKTTTNSWRVWGYYLDENNQPRDSWDSYTTLLGPGQEMEITGTYQHPGITTATTIIIHVGHVEGDEMPTANPGGPYYGTTGQNIQFQGSSTGGVGAITYSWLFGDGASSTDQNPTHAYATAGNYTVSLTVTDSEAHTDTGTTSAIITSTWIEGIPNEYIIIGAGVAIIALLVISARAVPRRVPYPA